MANELPTRTCDGCGQIWSSGSFLDPTIRAECGFCGEGLMHRRRLPDSVTVGLEQLGELPPVLAAAGHSTNGASAPVH